MKQDILEDTQKDIIEEMQKVTVKDITTDIQKEQKATEPHISAVIITDTQTDIMTV